MNIFPKIHKSKNNESEIYNNKEMMFFNILDNIMSIYACVLSQLTTRAYNIHEPTGICAHIFGKNFDQKGTL